MRHLSALALGALLLFGAYYASSELLPDLPQWAAVLWVGFALSALAFAAVAFALPLRRERALVIGLETKKLRLQPPVPTKTKIEEIVD